MSGSTGRLLVVDDEAQIIRGLKPALLAEGYVVETAGDGATALKKLALDPYDLVVLDLGLPDVDGKAVLTRLRDWCAAPVIVLSARQMEGEKIAALDAGADDYVNKPVSLDELMARIRANLRGQAPQGELAQRVSVGDLEIDFVAREARLQGDLVVLATREFDLLATFARFAGKVVTHRQAIAAVWGLPHQADTQSIRVLVSQIRQKIEAEPAQPELLLSEPGVGYRLVPGPRA